MAHDDKRRPSASASKAGLRSGEIKSSGKAVDSARPRAKAEGERPFDMWLQKQLHSMYDEIASEPLPNDLLNLIDHDAEKADGSDESDKPGGKS